MGGGGSGSLSTFQNQWLREGAWGVRFPSFFQNQWLMEGGMGGQVAPKLFKFKIKKCPFFTRILSALFYKKCPF